MGLFNNKNPNEAAYDGGKKHFTDVIKSEASGDMLLWRCPMEDFNTNSTLVVMPGETAIFIKGGTVEQTFENGTYKLSTENYPFISRLRNAFSGGVSTFNCVVYFFKKAHTTEIPWGTETPVQVRDKMLGIATKIRGRGSYKVQVANPGIFLEKMVGGNVPVTSQNDLNKYFRNEFQSKIKSVITRALNETDVELLGLESRLDEFGETIEPFMDEILGDYGLKCVRFVVSGLDIEDSALRAKYDEIGMDAIAKIRNAQADKAVFQTLGSDWERLQAASILTNMSKNEGAASFGGNLAMGLASGATMGQMASNMFGNMGVAQPAQPAAHAKPAPQESAEDPVETLGKLKKMLDAGLIEQAEYDAKKSEILSKM